MKNEDYNSIEKYMVAGYLPTIGIECHVQLKTKTKLFSSVSNEARAVAPNTLVNHVCFGLPGALPVLNERAVELAAKAAFALGAVPQKFSKFDRKHYFYPDLPKGYQISQFDEPIIAAGRIKIFFDDGSNMDIRITRAHLEEDAGKSIHPKGADYSLVDLNRAGTPLLEIVSEPEMHNATEAKAYAKELWLRMKLADVSDVDLYHGNMRFDVNVSVSKHIDELGTRTETKNLNSFRSIERAVEYEIERQIAVLESGDSVVQETRGWLDDVRKTVALRSKENAHDYRYFPDPDIPPVILTDEYIDNIASSIPKMPDKWREELKEIGLDRMQIESLLESQVMFSANFLELISSVDSKTAINYSNWITNIEIPLLRKFSESAQGKPKVIDSELRLKIFESVAKMVSENKLSSNGAKTLIEKLIISNSFPENLEQYAKDAGIIQISDSGELDIIVDKVIQENPKPVSDFISGEEKAIGFLVGQVMKLSQGQADPAQAQKILRNKMESN